MSYLGLLRQTATISRRQSVPLDGYGHESEAFDEVGSEPCLIQRPKISSIREVGGVIDMPVTACFLKQSTAVKLDDRLTVDGVTWLVRTEPSDAGGQGHHRETVVTEVPS